jgi:DNA-binding transcriptional LysR family regulator
MDKLISMKLFTEIIDTGSFIGAAEKLDISKAMASKYIQFLEDDLGIRLINRTSRKISLTEEGRIYFEHCKELFNELEETEASLKNSTTSPKGTLKVAIPNWFQFRYFAEGINKYLEKYPKVTVDLSLSDRVVDLVEEGIDLALRVTTEPHFNLIARRICEVKFHVVGSKEYFDKYGWPQKPSDLENHKYVNQTSSKHGNMPFKDENKRITIKTKEVASANTTSMVAQMVAAGIGYAPLPEFLINDEPFKSKLKIVLNDYPIDMKTYLFAVYLNRRYLSPKVRTFIDFMVDWFKKKDEI